MSKIKGFQMWTYYIPLERKFYSEKKSLWNLSPEMNWERVIVPPTSVKNRRFRADGRIDVKHKNLIIFLNNFFLLFSFLMRFLEVKQEVIVHIFFPDFFWAHFQGPPTKIGGTKCPTKIGLTIRIIRLCPTKFP